MKDKIIDLTLATKEEGITALVESEKFIEAVSQLARLISSSEASTLVGSILGAAAPRINGVYLNYKQNRFERNMTRLVDALSNKVASLESNYLGLNKEMKEKYRFLYAEMLLDNTVDERQVEKIDWNVNAFVALMNNDTNDNILQIFFDTLAEVTVLDVDVLKMYDYISNTDFNEIENKYGIDYDQLGLVKEKLVRLGLLTRKNDKVRDTNIDLITEYLQKVEVDSKKRNPQGVKFPNRIKKIGNTEFYRLTPLGWNFLKCIGETDSYPTN